MTIPGLRLELDSDVPVYRQIADGVKSAARRGELADGHRLPPTRDLARRLGVNRNTVVSAYDALATEGWVQSHTGRGTFLVVGPEPAADDEDWFDGFSRAADGLDQGGLGAIFSMVTAPDGISFVGSYPDPGLLPVEGFARALQTALDAGGASLLSYGPTSGHPPLRAALAERMAAGSGVGPEDVLVTNGAQQALDLAFRAFLDPGDAIIVEEPTYTGAHGVLSSLGARTVSVPVDDRGIRPDLLERALERHRPKLIYVQPTFQNPTATVMDRPRREIVLDLARRHRVPVVEDDWARELRFEGPDEPSLHALDRGRHVIYLSTFSKQLMPGIRIGWIVAPRAVQQRLVELKRIQDCGTSPLLQAALVEFLADGGLERHLERVRPVYRQRRDRMLAALDRHFPRDARWSRPPGGLFLWIRLAQALDGEELQLAARRRGVMYSRGELFQRDADGSRAMRLTYSAAAPAEIDRGVEILGTLIRERMKQREPQRPDAIEAMPIL